MNSIRKILDLKLICLENKSEIEETFDNYDLGYYLVIICQHGNTFFVLMYYWAREAWKQGFMSAVRLLLQYSV